MHVATTVGETVILPCHSSASSKFVWRSEKYGTIAVGGDILRANKARFSLQINETGDHNLVISSVMVNDEDIYQCIEDNGKQHDVILTVSGNVKCSYSLQSDR